MSPPAAPGGTWSGTLIGTVGILLWATETALAKLTAGLPTFEVVTLAFAAAACLSPLAWWWTGERPGLAFRQPPGVWLLTVPSLVAYHATIYYALQWAPAAPAAILQGCTPLFLVLGSALLPGGHLRWWHAVGLAAGVEGLTGLVLDGANAEGSAGSSSCLVLIGGAAGLWGLYSLLVSRLGSVPTSAMGVFYAASAGLGFVLTGTFEVWVTPDRGQWIAIAALGLLPMGLALFCWDHGLKRGDVRALGVASYLEPLVGAGLVVALGQGDLRWPMLASGFVIVGGAVLGAADAFEGEAEAAPRSRPATAALTIRLPRNLLDQLEGEAARRRQSAGAFVREVLEREAALPFEGSGPLAGHRPAASCAEADDDPARRRDDLRRAA